METICFCAARRYDVWSHWRLLSLVSRSEHDRLPAPMLRNLHRHSAGLVKPIMRTYLTQVSIADAWECRIIGDRFVWADGWVWDVQEGIWTRGGLLRRTSRWLAGINGSLCNNKELELCTRRYITFAENCAGFDWEHLTLSITKGVLRTSFRRNTKVWVHACLNFILMDYSHLDYCHFTTKQSGLHLIVLLVYLDYQNLESIPNRLHCHLDYIRSDYFWLCNVFSYKKA